MKSEREELDELEKKWMSRMTSFTTPVPTPEDTLDLIARVKEQAQKPEKQAEVAPSDHQTGGWMDLIISQWSFYGMRSWLMSAGWMICFSLMIGAQSITIVPKDEAGVFWIQAVTLTIVLSIAYTFRPQNEGMAMLERLSVYSLAAQTFVRLCMVMGFQWILAIPFSFVIPGLDNGWLFLWQWTIPLFFFAVITFVMAERWGMGASLSVSLMIWGGQWFARKVLPEVSLMVQTEELSFRPVQLVSLVVAFLLLGAWYISQRRREI
ncbi:hypothetical protein [Marininema halotolerans]|uniref:hypothetical protein n=1 Tax=Marininema halotolerans TaxID=1155944 RepID=UPI000B843990|nr:hypothetical protein [Marininema halotolerans]